MKLWITPWIALLSIALSWCVKDPWHDKIPEFQATIQERQSALLKLRESDIKKLTDAGYSRSVNCSTIFFKKWSDTKWNPHEVVQVHSVTVSNPKDGDHFYELPAREKVFGILETYTWVDYQYHPIGWTGDIDLDSIEAKTFICEDKDSKKWVQRQSWMTKHIMWVNAIELKKPS